MSDAAFQANGLITLTTDFGLSDPYAGVMKGAILTRHPAASVIDLSHQVPMFQPQLAGFWLARTWPHFPAGTVHLAVVDPGVGTARAMVVLIAAQQVFVAPDNGLLDAVFASTPYAQWRVLQPSDLNHLQLAPPSRTFHGRDVFGPLVAEIAAGRERPERLGTVVSRMSIPPPATGQGVILWADRYGNLVTDIDGSHLSRFTQPVLQYRDQHLAIHPSYGHAPRGELLALINSWGTLEIAEAQGHAQQRLQAHPGEAVRLVEQP